MKVTIKYLSITITFIKYALYYSGGISYTYIIKHCLGHKPQSTWKCLINLHNYLVIA